MTGLLAAAALLLIGAGLAKLRAPRLRSALRAAGLPGASRLPGPIENRLLGAVELATGLVVLLAGGRPAAALVLLVFGLLALLSARMVAVEAGQDCGCFAKPSPVTHWHTGVNLAAALAGLAGLVRPARALPAELARHPGTGAALALAAVVLAYLAYLTMTALPELRAAAAELEVAR
ncbi:MAG TPA: MauE/DoxX family redox-associated membrane protein [Jatrophihabitans sp.]|nr:MauE/DoxX family redox-associated membrane protein [Jatrophihabitans sp.]